MFFMMSGISASNYKTEKHGFIKFCMSKWNRLGLGLIFSMIVYLIPSLYIRQEFAPIGRINDPEGNPMIEWNFIKYVQGIVNGRLVFKLGQLWFLPVLIIVSIVLYPLLAFMRRRKSK